MKPFQMVADGGPVVAAYLKLLPPQVPCAYERDNLTDSHFLRIGALHSGSNFYLLFSIANEDIDTWTNEIKRIYAAPVIDGVSLEHKSFSVVDLVEFFAEIREATIKVFDKAQINSILEVLAMKRWKHTIEVPPETMINKLLWLFNGDINA